MSEKDENGVQFQPAVTKRASEIIVDQIRERILRQELKPGDRLPSERNMMEMFQRSRPTVREALRMLERSGYIRTIAGSNGAVVLEPDNHNLQKSIQEAIQIRQIDLRELSEYRSINEVATVVWACQRRTEEDLEQLRDCLDRMAGTELNPAAFIALDSEFHSLIAAASKNAVSLLMIRPLSNLIQNFIRAKLATMTPEAQQDMLSRGIEIHEEIYRAIEQRDDHLAREKMQKHLNEFEVDMRLEDTLSHS